MTAISLSSIRSSTPFIYLPSCACDSIIFYVGNPCWTDAVDLRKITNRIIWSLVNNVLCSCRSDVNDFLQFFRRSLVEINAFIGWSFIRSGEHTSELQSRGHLVCRLLLEKKKTKSYLQAIP